MSDKPKDPSSDNPEAGGYECVSEIWSTSYTYVDADGETHMYSVSHGQGVSHGLAEVRATGRPGQAREGKANA